MRKGVDSPVRRRLPVVTVRMQRELAAVRRRLAERNGRDEELPMFLDYFDHLVSQMPITMWIAFR